VWLERTNLPLPYESTKLTPKRYGPFPITQKISDTTYRLKLPGHWKIHDTFHAKLLTPYKQTDKYGPNFLEPPPELLEGKPEWEVEEIMGQRQLQNKRQYLIRWKDYSPAHDSWEDESAIHAPLLIQAYQQRLEPQSAQLKPSISKKADKTRTKISQQTPPSVTWSGRMSKPTSKAHSASTRVLRIRTSEVVPIKSSPTIPSMSFTFSKPLNLTPDNDTAQQSSSTSPTPGPRGQHGGPTRPGSTRPVTPQSAVGGTNEGDDDRSDSDIRPLTDREAFFTPTTLAELWVLARAARAYWKANQVFPIGLDKYALDIFMVTSSPRPTCVADIDEHNPMDHAALLGTLRGWEDELESYIEEEQPEQEEGEELLPRTQGHQHLEGPMEEQGV
jgi:Chromo (CHRromatin Organisation MOdifier) domain